MWVVCFCVHMSVWRTGERNTTKKGLTTPHKTLGLSQKPCPSLPVKWTWTQPQWHLQGSMKPILSKSSRLVLCLWKSSPKMCFYQILLGSLFFIISQTNGPAGIHRWMDAMPVDLKTLLMAGDRYAMSWIHLWMFPYLTFLKLSLQFLQGVSSNMIYRFRISCSALRV